MTILRFVPWFATALAGVGTSRLATADCYVDSVNGVDTNNGTSATSPVMSQAHLPAGCTTVRYARGSVFNEAMKSINGATTYTNYGDSTKPQPDFVLPKGTATSVFQTFSTVTIDGLKFQGSHNTSGGGASFDSGAGICVYLQGANSTIKNSEVTDCDFGVMLQGNGSLATNNFVHDVNGQALDGTTDSDPNSVGGGKGIYAMASDVEVSYNTIVNCITFPSWTGADGSTKGGCDGGATEVALQSGATISGYKNHHNFAYNTCGFFQVSTVPGTNGTFSNSEFYYNVMIDTAWMVLAQVNNTNFTQMNWYNNTVVQHKGAGATADQGMLMEMWNGPSSGKSGGVTPANQIFLTNNLIVLEGINDFYDFNANWTGADMAVNTPIVMKSNIFLNNTSIDPGFVKIGDGSVVPSPKDFDLTSDTMALGGGNPTLSQGTPIAGMTLDFLNRAVPSSNGNTDIGAFQYNSAPAADAGDAGTLFEVGTDAGSVDVAPPTDSHTMEAANAADSASDSAPGSDTANPVTNAGDVDSAANLGTSGADSGTPPTTTSKGGCGCRMGEGQRQSSTSASLLFALALATVARRRSQRS